MTIPAFGHAEWIVALVNHLWQSTVVVGIAWLLTLALRRNHARTRYWVWMVASVKFLVPFAPLIHTGHWLQSLLTAPPVPQPAFEGMMQQITQPFIQTATPAAIAHVSSAPAAAAPYVDLLPWVLPVVWLCGFVAIAQSWARGWLQACAAVRASSRQTELGDVSVLFSPSRVEPGVFGIVRPVLLLPEGIDGRLTAAQLNAILAHEMCHIRRRDNLTAAIHMTVAALFWFHPAVWWISARLVEERERACDEAVLGSGNQAEIYAESILQVCKFYLESPIVCISGVSGSDLKRRILRIMTETVSHKLDFSRKLLLCLAVVLAVGMPVTFGLIQAAAQAGPENAAKDLSGTWQGTLHAGRDLRTVVRITNAGNGKYKAQFFSIDQGGQPLPVDSVTRDGSTFKMTINSIGGSYEGKLSTDGQSISGTLTQGQPFPLVLTRATPETAWTIPPPHPPIPPMADDADPSFEVATIKLTPPDGGGGFRFNGHEFTTRGTKLINLLAIAYGVHPKQIVNAPDWASSVRYDITGVPDAPGRPDQKQQGILIKKLLVDRFQLKSHTETRVLSVYAITAVKDDPKMTKNTGPANAPISFFFTGALGNLTVRNLTMSDFAKWMQAVVMDRPVVDQTGLTDRYDFQLKWTPDDSQFTQFRTANAVVPPTNDNPNAPPNLYTAIQQEIGLKIEPAKAPDVVLVIDHVEKPSAN